MLRHGVVGVMPPSTLEVAARLVERGEVHGPGGHQRPVAHLDGSVVHRDLEVALGRRRAASDGEASRRQLERRGDSQTVAVRQVPHDRADRLGLVDVIDRLVALADRPDQQVRASVADDGTGGHLPVGAVGGEHPEAAGVVDDQPGVDRLTLARRKKSGAIGPVGTSRPSKWTRVSQRGE